jgi:hypothetical protein
MDEPLAAAFGRTLDAMLGPSGVGVDAGIMAAQLDRATGILARPPVPSGRLFETEPATYYASLEAHAATP